MSVRVAVLGSTGMLGHVVATRLASDPRFEVLSFNRQDSRYWFDAASASFSHPLDVDYVINCAGVIWQAKNPSRHETFAINSAFPWKLQDLCSKSGAKLIHVSTDCVFSGRDGSYTEDALTDADNDYGISKFIGEPSNAMVIRSSVIGPELKTNRSFFEWARSNKDQTVTGFTNHFWNGVTSVEYARVCRDIILNGFYSPGVHHVFSNSISKYDLLCLVSDVFNLNLTVEPMKSDPVDRTLSTIKPLCETLNVPSVKAMLMSLNKDMIEHE